MEKRILRASPQPKSRIFASSSNGRLCARETGGSLASGVHDWKGVQLTGYIIAIMANCANEDAFLVGKFRTPDLFS
jgi:hypothetical protein